MKGVQDTRGWLRSSSSSRSSASYMIEVQLYDRGATGLRLLDMIEVSSFIEPRSCNSCKSCKPPSQIFPFSVGGGAANILWDWILKEKREPSLHCFKVNPSQQPSWRGAGWSAGALRGTCPHAVLDMRHWSCCLLSVIQHARRAH